MPTFFAHFFAAAAVDCRRRRGAAGRFGTSGACCYCASGAVLVAEMFILLLEPLDGQGHHPSKSDPHIGSSLDIGAAAVLVASIGVSIVGTIIFGHRLGILLGLVVIRRERAACSTCRPAFPRQRKRGGLARGRRWLAALVGLVGAAAIVAAFAFTGGFFDLVRSDSLLLALEALALWLALRGGT